MFDSVSEKMNEHVGGFFRGIRARIFGVNNEKLDFLMDSFYKLTPQHRNAVIAGIICSILIFVTIAILVFFKQYGHLKTEMNNSLIALKELESHRQVYESQTKQYEQLDRIISTKVGNFRLKPFIEQLMNEFSISVDDIKETLKPMSTENPLSDKYTDFSASMNINKISLKKLINFLVQLESSDKLLKVRSLKIKARYGDKLYFDAITNVSGVKKKL